MTKGWLAYVPKLIPAAFALLILSLLAWRYQDLPMEECQWCHSRRWLNRHHVVSQVADAALINERTNLVVLCRRCHFVLGHRCNWRTYNPDVLTIVQQYTNCVRIGRID